MAAIGNRSGSANGVDGNNAGAANRGNDAQSSLTQSLAEMDGIDAVVFSSLDSAADLTDRLASWPARGNQAELEALLVGYVGGLSKARDRLFAAIREVNGPSVHANYPYLARVELLLANMAARSTKTHLDGLAETLNTLTLDPIPPPSSEQ